MGRQRPARRQEKEGRPGAGTGVGAGWRLPGLWHQQAEQRSLFSQPSPCQAAAQYVFQGAVSKLTQQLVDLILLVFR